MVAVQPFILPLVCLLWSIAGLLTFLKPQRALRKKLERGSKGEGSAGGGQDSADRIAEHAMPGSAAAGEDTGRLLWRIRLNAGFWFSLGLAGVLLSGLTAGIASDGVRVSGHSGPSALSTRVLEKALEYREAQSVPGMVLAIVTADQEVVVGAGQQATGSALAPDGDTVFEIGSITKVFTGILLAESIERGELTLDMTAHAAMERGAALPAAVRDTVTLRHLTTHSSGFPRLPGSFSNLTNAIQIAFGGDPHRRYSLDEFHEALRSVELEFTPGSRSVYSNFGVSLLGHLLAKRAGLTYEELMLTRIARPLGMTSTVVTLSDENRGRLAQGYRAGLRLLGVQIALKSSTWDMPDHYAGAGGVRSTGNDMLIFLKANMGRASTPLGSAIRASHEALMDSDSSSAIGMNWLLKSRGPDLPAVIWHNGGTGGHRSFLGFTADGRYGLVVLANTAISMDEFAFELLEDIEKRF